MRVAGGLQVAQDGRPAPAGPGVRGDAHGFVDHDHVVIVVEDAHAGHRCGGRSSGSRPAGGRPLPGAVTSSRPWSVYQDVPVAGQFPGRVRESPSRRDSATSTLSPTRPSGTGRSRGSATVLPCGCHVRGAPLVAEGVDDREPDRGADDPDVGDVADEESAVVDEVHDVALPERGRGGTSLSMRFPIAPPASRPNATRVGMWDVREGAR